MKKFSFRLARVLRVRRIEEQVARAAFLERQALANAAQESFEQATTLTRGMERELAEELSSGPVDPRRVLQSQHSIDGMAKVRTRRHQRAQTLDLQAQRARDPWSETRTEVRALEHIEETKRERFRAEQEKQENLELDEVATRRTKDARRVREQEDKTQ